MRKNREKIKIFDSLKWKIDRSVIVTVTVVIVITILMTVPAASGGIHNVVNSYIADLASSKGMMLEKAIDEVKDRDQILKNESAGLLKDCKVHGMTSSYAYLVSGDGTMLYHPTKEKIGQPVENSVIRGVVSRLKAGESVKNKAVLYKFNGVKKYAGYYVSKDRSFIIVVTCDYSEIMTPVRNLVIRMSLLGIITAAAAGVVIFVIMRMRLKPMDDLSDSIDRMGSLDLTRDETLAELCQRKDEFGVMSRVLEDMENSLKDTIKTISCQADALTKASDKLLESTDSINQTAGQVDSAVNEIAQGATSQAQETQKANNAVIEIGDQITAVSSSVSSLYSAAQKMTEADKEAGSMITDLNAVNQKTQEAIGNISDSTKQTNISASEIKEAASLISDIAKQTNLLSLNASIEAARAGEHGKGFAVVAESIGDLANQSKDAAEKINDIIEKLVDDSTAAMNIMNDVTDITKQQSDEITKTSDIFSQINDGISEAQNVVTTIAEQTEGMNKSKTSIIQILENLSAIAEENAAGTEESSASVTQMTSSMDGIRTQSEEVRNSAVKLTDEVNKFRM